MAIACDCGRAAKNVYQQYNAGPDAFNFNKTVVPEVGQGFADELFRVFAKAHPEIELIPENCSVAVQQMTVRALSGGAAR